MIYLLANLILIFRAIFFSLHSKFKAGVEKETSFLLATLVGQFSIFQNRVLRILKILWDLVKKNSQGMETHNFEHRGIVI